MSKIRDFTTSYNQKNIVGSVTQSGGIPTGAIIERGSNSNGTWIKWADGTLICWGSKSGITAAITQSNGSSFFTPPGSEAFITLPSTFIDSNFSVSVFQVRTSFSWVTAAGSVTASSFNVWFASPTSITYNDMTIKYIAVGRWF